MLGKGRAGRDSGVCVGRTNKDVGRDTGRYSGICRRALQRHPLAYTLPLLIVSYQVVPIANYIDFCSYCSTALYLYLIFNSMVQAAYILSTVLNTGMTAAPGWSFFFTWARTHYSGNSLRVRTSCELSIQRMVLPRHDTPHEKTHQYINMARPSLCTHLAAAFFTTAWWS